MLEISAYLRPFKGKQCCLFVFSFLYLLHLGLFSSAVAKDFATLLLLQYFPSHYSVTVVVTERLSEAEHTGGVQKTGRTVTLTKQDMLNLENTRRLCRMIYYRGKAAALLW